MYTTMLFLHSVFRWLGLAFMLLSIYRALRGYLSNAAFSKTDNALRHWTATVVQVQMVIGFVLYFKSPIVDFFWKDSENSFGINELSFFGVIHISLMFLSVVILSLGSAFAKRKTTDHDKYKTMLLWFSLALLIILISIPWPFSPLAQRPYFRTL